jgi:UDP-N-acetyl-D-glucosamine dehydrogenase
MAGGGESVRPWSQQLLHHLDPIDAAGAGYWFVAPRIRPMTIGIIGLGYVGLPLAAAFADAGHEVVGVDSDSRAVEAIAAGRSLVADVADDDLAALGGRLRTTTDPASLADCDAIVICVPTPLANQREPDLSYVVDAARNLSPLVRAGQLVILESTTYPGTTRERLRPILEESGLSAGLDFHLAYSPERIDPGRTDYTIRSTPKVVGGLTAACRERAVALYARICDEVVPVSSPEAAELSKLLENIFRSVNIALVNELAILCDRMMIDIWEVIDAAATKPFGFMRFEPGPGMGGHCLPIDPFYLAFKAREHDLATEFIELAGKVNQQQPHFCVAKVVRALNDVTKPVRGSRVVLLGVSYKAGVGDLREAPALKIARLLRELGAEVSYHDHVAEVAELGLCSGDLGEELRSCDVACVVTAHPEVDYERVVAEVPLVVDFRGITRGISASNLVRL